MLKVGGLYVQQSTIRLYHKSDSVETVRDFDPIPVIPFLSVWRGCGGDGALSREWIGLSSPTGSAIGKREDEIHTSR